jgi:RNA polymerase sigma-70 factor, ECF subfamily
VTDPELRRLCDEGRLAEATTRALAEHGTKILSFLVGSMRNEHEASEAFSIFCAELWERLPTFRWECSFRTWSYILARHAIGRVARERGKARAHVELPREVEEMAATVRSATPEYLKTAARQKVAAVRRQLDPEDKQLLILRVNRELPWEDIALVVLGPGEHGPAAIARTAAALRKRFERLRAKIKELAGRPGGGK